MHNYSIIQNVRLKSFCGNNIINYNTSLAVGLLLKSFLAVFLLFKLKFSAPTNCLKLLVNISIIMASKITIPT